MNTRELIDAALSDPLPLTIHLEPTAQEWFQGELEKAMRLDPDQSLTMFQAARETLTTRMLIETKAGRFDRKVAKAAITKMWNPGPNRKAILEALK